jgi:TetR/AcrR family transcriptional regulator, fatty acid metabolism regulator protein
LAKFLPKEYIFFIANCYSRQVAMPKEKTKNSSARQYPYSEGPPGRIKIANALRDLLAEKDFNSITTSEISNKSGVNEALIYRYFGDKRGLLHQVLKEHLDEFVKRIALDQKGPAGSLNKLRRLIGSTIDFYDRDRVFSKMLLIEVRNYPGYFDSETYMTIKQYTNMLLAAIEEGVADGEIRSDVSPAYLRQIILGAIEHMVLPALIHNSKIDVEAYQDEISSVVFNGIRTADASARHQRRGS